MKKIKLGFFGASSFFFGVINMQSEVNASPLHFSSDTVVSVEEFIENVKNPEIDRMEFSPSEKPQFEGFFVKPSDLFAPMELAVYYLFGNIETEYRDYEYRSAYQTILAFRKAGYKVLVDGYTEAAEAKQYFRDNNMLAFYWSSHGTPDGYITVPLKDGRFTTLAPSEIDSAGSNLRFSVLCSCYSLRSGAAYQKKLNNADVYGFQDTVTLATCGLEAGNRFIEKFNKYF